MTAGSVLGVVDDDQEWSVEELSARTRLPVRTIREYQTMRVLDPPVRRGRRGFYNESHLRRLRLIARLQERGYSLAGIRDLFEAWAEGRDLAGVLDDPEAPFVDEAPALIDHASLRAVLPSVPAERLDELIALGVVCDWGPEQFCVPSPSLLRLLADATANGIGVDESFAIISSITFGVKSIADTVAAMLRPVLANRATDKATMQLLQRARGLVAQGTSRLLLHELGQALLDMPDRSHPELAGTIDRLRVGAVPTHLVMGKKPKGAK